MLRFPKRNGDKVSFKQMLYTALFFLTEGSFTVVGVLCFLFQIG